MTDLLTSQRNFLTRAFSVAAAGAAITAPIVTVASAEERLRHHAAGVEAAMQDLVLVAKVDVRGNCLDGHHPTGRSSSSKATMAPAPW